jgi:hypothetical protein
MNKNSKNVNSNVNAKRKAARTAKTNAPTVDMSAPLVRGPVQTVKASQVYSVLRYNVGRVNLDDVFSAQDKRVRSLDTVGRWESFSPATLMPYDESMRDDIVADLVDTDAEFAKRIAASKNKDETVRLAGAHQRFRDRRWDSTAQDWIMPDYIPVNGNSRYNATYFTKSEITDIPAEIYSRPLTVAERNREQLRADVVTQAFAALTPTGRAAAYRQIVAERGPSMDTFRAVISDKIEAVGATDKAGVDAVKQTAKNELYDARIAAVLDWMFPALRIIDRLSAKGDVDGRPALVFAQAFSKVKAANGGKREALAPYVARSNVADLAKYNADASREWEANKDNSGPYIPLTMLGNGPDPRASKVDHERYASAMREVESIITRKVEGGAKKDLDVSPVTTAAASHNKSEAVKALAADLTQSKVDGTVALITAADELLFLAEQLGMSDAVKILDSALAKKRKNEAK